jgi:hypothetical protein
MRDPSRPPAHPLVEMAYDLRAALDRALSEDGDPSLPQVKVYHRMREGLRWARRCVEALEQLVGDLESQSGHVLDRQSNEDDNRDDDFQIIAINSSRFEG